MKKERTIPYRRDIDGLRALAVLMVLVFHFQLSPYGEGGFLGVDIFFVISGYLITSIILKHLNEDTFLFGDFYVKRILRLAPVLFAVLLMAMVGGAFIYLPSQLTELSKQVVATQLYSSNLYFWQNINYFGLHADSVPLLHTWSLAVEEQFYLVFPVFIVAIYRYARPYFWYVIVLSALLSFALNILFLKSDPEATFYLVPTRGWEFLLGSIVVLITQYTPSIGRKVSETLSLTGITLILAGIFLYTKDISFPGYYALLPCVGTGLIILGGSDQQTFISQVLSKSAPVFIGRLSYSLYLVHWPIHIFAVEILGEKYSIWWRLAMLILTFMLSVLLLRYVEEPTRRGSPFKSNKQVYGYYVLGIAASIAICFAVIASHGLPFRFSDSALKMAAYSQDRPPPMPHCQPKGQPHYTADDFCLIGEATAEPKWLVFGDSHAGAAKEAFDKWLRAKGESGLFMFRHACPPLKGISIFRAKGECAKFNANVLEFVTNAPHLTEVVLISTWVYGKTGAITTHPDIWLGKKASFELFSSSFADTLDYLSEANKQVYIWGPLPGARASVPDTLARANDRAKAQKDLAYTLQEHLENHSYFYDVFEDNEQKIQQLFSPAEALCADTGRCKVLVDDVPVYFDSSHLTQSLSDYWAEVLRAQEQNLPEVKKLRAAGASVEVF